MQTVAGLTLLLSSGAPRGEEEGGHLFKDRDRQQSPLSEEREVGQDIPCVLHVQTHTN